MVDDIKAALETLKRGGVILYPTDTVWGLGCDATNEVAVKRLQAIKHRPAKKVMLVLMDNPAFLDRYVDDVPEVAWDLIELSDKPLTIVFSGAKNLAPSLVGEDGTIGIRFTSEAFSRELTARFRKPVVSTSANLAGEPAPGIFADIKNDIIGSADYVVKYRQDDRVPGKPSSIIKLGRGGQVEIIRP